MYYKYIKRKDTRERFAFVALSTYVGFVIVLITLLFAQNPLFSWVVQVANTQLGFTLPDYAPTDIKSNLFIFFLSVFFLTVIIGFLYTTWNGLKSTRYVNIIETGGTGSLYDDFIFYLRHRDKIEIYKEEKTNKRDVFAQIEPDTRLWHTRALQLLKLYDQQYEFDEQRDWHREYHAFIGRYASNGKKIGIVCFHEAPSEEALRTYLKFTNPKPEEFQTHIIAISGTGVKENKTHQGIDFQYRYESELLDNLINFTDYKRYIKALFEKETLPGSDRCLADIYVPLQGELKTIVQEKLQTEHSVENVETHILDWLQLANEKEHLAILGDYGQGKTVLTIKIVKELLDHPDKYKRVPILIPLRGFSPRTNDILDILGKWANRFGGKAQALLELHKAGRLLIILDGFDEMDLVGDTELLFSHFNQIWTLAAEPKSRIIITGRPNLFADDVERRDALGILPQRIHLPYSKALYINPMTVEQIQGALREVQPQTKAEILQAMESTGQDSSFRELMTRPSTLYQLSTIWNSELANLKDRLNSAVVIGKFIDKDYERQEAKKVNFLTTHERNYFMTGIAVGMMRKNQYTNQIRATELQDIIDQLWANYPLFLPPYKDAQQGNSAKDFLPKRLKENQNAREVVWRDVLSGGILVQDLSGRDVFRFAHKSFLEYFVGDFYADFLVKKDADKNRLMLVNHIAKTFKFKQTQLAPSRDVERFAAEQVVAKMELLDKQGKAVSIEGNEVMYKKAIFKKVNPYWYGRCFPNFTGWCTLHPAQKWLSWIILLSFLFLAGTIITQNDEWRLFFSCTSMLLYLFVLAIIGRYKMHLETKKPGSAIIPLSSYNGYMRLYVECCRLLHQSFSPINSSFQKVIQLRDGDFRYRLITLCILSIFFSIAVSGVVSGVVAGVLVGEGTGVVVKAVSVMIGVAGIVPAMLMVMVSIFVKRAEEREGERPREPVEAMASLLPSLMIIALAVMGAVMGAVVVVVEVAKSGSGAVMETKAVAELGITVVLTLCMFSIGVKQLFKFLDKPNNSLGKLEK